MALLSPKIKKPGPLLIYFIILMLASFISLKVSAQGNLLITPKRVVFEDSKKSEELNLANIGKDSATYIISFIQIRMKDDGTVEKITEPDSGQIFADKYVRFFPRTVTLAPNEAQTVKIQLTRNAEIMPGEYRSHLYFRATSSNQPLGEDDPKKKKDTGISVKLIPIFGISMPVIVRMGESTTEISLSNFQIHREADPFITLTFNRKGNMSSYGDLSIEHVSSQGKVTQVGIVRGLSVYTPNTTRNFSLPLSKVANVDYNSGKLRAVYSDQSPKPKKLAETEISLSLL